MSELQKALQRAIDAIEQQEWKPGPTMELREINGRLRLVRVAPLVIKDSPCP